MTDVSVVLARFVSQCLSGSVVQYLSDNCSVMQFVIIVTHCKYSTLIGCVIRRSVLNTLLTENIQEREINIRMKKEKKSKSNKLIESDQKRIRGNEKNARNQVPTTITRQTNAAKS